jgi:hypothetical protein
MYGRKPLFAMIPYFGGGWSVQYHGDDHGTESRSGYGEFPAAEYPDVPVVDCRTVKSFRGFPDWPVEHYGRQSTLVHYPTLAEFLAKAAECGATIS